MTGADDASVSFRRIIDNSRDAYVEFDSDSVLTEWSRSAESLLGWHRHEVVGRPVTTVVAPDFFDILEQGIAVLLTSAGRADETSEIPVVVAAAAAVDTAGADGPDEVVGSEASPEGVTVELELRHRDGATVLANATVFVTGTAGHRRVGAFIHDAGEGGQHRPLVLGRLHDPLTGLPLRDLFTRRIAQDVADLGRRVGSVAVAVIDIDRFKAVNDALGHDAGDELLVAAVGRLRAAAGPHRPVLGRLGGDQMMASFHASDEAAGQRAEAFTQRVLDAFGVPFTASGTEVFLSVSVGIAAMTSPSIGEPAADAAALLVDADAAMHRNKLTVTGSHTVFETGMRQEVVARLETEHALHRAIERQELTLYYQPVVPLARAKPDLTAVEALVRWLHPEQGLVNPEKFIPLAEENGLIIPIGNWVLAEACRQLRQWRSADEVGPKVAIGVNLSARQIEHPALLETLEAVLAASGLPPECLTLEITESALLTDAESALSVLRQLKSVGVTLAIDDFGTGYSSLSYLQRLPLDILKVDKAFVGALPTARGGEIVAAVVNLAHALGLKVVAEGVETSIQLDILRELECDFAQGFYFSYPVTADELPTSLLAPPAAVRSA